MTRSKGPSYGGEDEAKRLRRFHSIEHGIGRRATNVESAIVDGATNDLPTTQQMLYPALWSVVHRAWNANSARSALLPCHGPDDGAYDPEQHPICFDLAGALRVELHAAGLWIEAKGAIE